VPINTIQNWMAEFNHWVPSPEEVVSSVNGNFELKLRDRCYDFFTSSKNGEKKLAIFESNYSYIFRHQNDRYIGFKEK
jgi:hypothetical protein